MAVAPVPRTASQERKGITKKRAGGADDGTRPLPETKFKGPNSITGVFGKPDEKFYGAITSITGLRLRKE